MARIFIRQTRTNNKITGEGYFTHRLVRGERIAGKVRQITVLNLGRHFPILQDHWPLLCSRIEQLLGGQSVLCPLECPDHVERAAQRYAAQLISQAPVSSAALAVSGAPDQSEPGTGHMAPIERQPAPKLPDTGGDWQTVDLDSIQDSQVRSVAVEHLALHACTQLGLVDKLAALGINGVMRACILGNLIGRMAAPASELATWSWLQTESALGELLDVDFCAMSHMRLYRASDVCARGSPGLQREWDRVFSAY